MPTNIQDLESFLRNSPATSRRSIRSMRSAAGRRASAIRGADPVLGRAFVRPCKGWRVRGYCDEVKGIAGQHGLAVTELSTHLQGQLVAVHPAYDEAFDGFAPPSLHGKPKERQAWAVDQLMLAAKASRNLGLDSHVTFSGALAWPFAYPWPQRPPGLIETAFAELAARGGRSSINSTPTGSMSATSFIPARIFSTARASSCSSIG